MKICINNYQSDLYCLECKELIKIGEKYVIDYEICGGETIDKYYHVDHFPIIDETDEVYILKEEE